METVLLTTYVLMWPALVAILLVVISRAFLREWAEARRERRPMI